ncbi:Aste57867_12577 [Aphanomyces stellatus]|nr:hypothetical protein As57867_012531 [Aphanomyces stellatus]VFT89428.1 Aste57867_12577 [Aphanomyces stellatus]
MYGVSDNNGHSEAELTAAARQKSHYMAALTLHLVLLKRRVHQIVHAFRVWHDDVFPSRTWRILMPVKLASTMVQIKYRLFVTKRELCHIYDRLLELESKVPP